LQRGPAQARAQSLLGNAEDSTFKQAVEAGGYRPRIVPAMLDTFLAPALLAMATVRKS
jgi:hypothetical protein